MTFNSIQYTPQHSLSACLTSIQIILLWWSASVIAFSLTTAYSSEIDPQLNTWLRQANLPPQTQRALLARVIVDFQSNTWLVEQNQQLYVLVYQPFAPNLPAQAKQANRSIAASKARHLLALYAAGEYYERQGFTDRETIAKTLIKLDNITTGRLLPGLSAQTAVLDYGAVALVWINLDHIINYRHHPPSLQQFRPAYCESLYPTAQVFFYDQHYQQALNIYQDMHQLQCRQPMAYFLDAAECFLALKQIDDAKRMATHLLVEHATALSSAVLERTGDVLFRCGDDNGAKAAYELAQVKLAVGQ